jgi:hypothetical protein
MCEKVQALGKSTHLWSTVQQACTVYILSPNNDVRARSDGIPPDTVAAVHGIATAVQIRVSR